MDLMRPENTTIADVLERVAALLELQKQARYRIHSYRRAARAVGEADFEVADVLLEQGPGGLRVLPGVGRKMAAAIEEIVETGRLALLERLEAEGAPDVPFVRLPAIGPEMARRIHDALGVETLEELEVVAHDGTLAQVPGMNAARVAEVCEELARLLGSPTSRRTRRRRLAGRPSTVAAPPVELVFELDAEYRTKAEAGELRTIAPKRFNPEGESWLPILKAKRRQWSFTLLFSNTARAHELGKTREWVVAYYSEGGEEDQCTVVTAGGGPLRGRRVVAGREEECRDYYAGS